VAGASADDETVAARLTAEWESRLRRLLTDTAADTATATGSIADENAVGDSIAGDSIAGDGTADGNAAAELRRVTDTLTRLLAETTGQSPTSITQHARASGHASVIQVGRDARIGDVMLEERPVHVQPATDAAVIIQVSRRTDADRRGRRRHRAAVEHRHRGADRLIQASATTLLAVPDPACPDFRQC
jgi:hypothetical protein